ncbi:hypothetical protein TNCV_4759411 [Trichonephila clavipes]|nr:hypothetical protein TNCV_4759411 [Trichonephila clavipes]
MPNVDLTVVYQSKYASCSMEAYIFRLYTAPSAESLSPFALEPLVDRDRGQVVRDSWVLPPLFTCGSPDQVFNRQITT